MVRVRHCARTVLMGFTPTPTVSVAVGHHNATLDLPSLTPQPALPAARPAQWTKAPASSPVRRVTRPCDSRLPFLEPACRSRPVRLGATGTRAAARVKRKLELAVIADIQMLGFVWRLLRAGRVRLPHVWRKQGPAGHHVCHLYRRRKVCQRRRYPRHQHPEGQVRR